MIRIIAFGDTQFHPWMEDKRPDHWTSLLGIFRDVYRYATLDSVQANYVIFLGDLFEAKQALRPDIVAHVKSHLKRWSQYGSERGVDTLMVMGNHDYYRRHPYAIEITCPYHVRTPDVTPLRRSGIALLDYGDIAQVQDMEYSLLFTHMDVGRGAILQNGYEQNGRLSVPHSLIAQKKGRIAIINGHYHVPQIIRVGPGTVPIICVGSPFQHSWRDADSKTDMRGFVDIRYYQDKGTCEVDFINLPHYPRFYSGMPNPAYANPFLRAHVRKEMATAAAVDYPTNSSNQRLIEDYVRAKAPKQRWRRLTVQGMKLLANENKER